MPLCYLRMSFYHNSVREFLIQHSTVAWVKNVNYVSNTVLSALIFNCVRNAIYKDNYPPWKMCKVSLYGEVRCNY